MVGSTELDRITVDGQDYYLIENKAQLNAIRTESASGSLDKNYILINDIDMQAGKANYSTISSLLSNDKTNYTQSELETFGNNLNSLGVDKWTAIGDNTDAFTGYFDGNGHKITNMVIDTGNDNQCLFGVVDGATIENLGISNSYIEGSNATGSLIGDAKGETVVDDCYSYNNAIFRLCQLLRRRQFVYIIMPNPRFHLTSSIPTHRRPPK